MTVTQLTLNVDEVATVLGYRRRTRPDQVDRRVIYRLVEAGELPAPINAALHKSHWRWSVARIESYVERQAS